jgi:hypothetical protein
MDLLSGLSIERPKPTRTMPTWDLALVLRSLLSSPFEPIGKASIKFLTFKTVFLLALATGARVSEINAIDCNSIHFKPNYTEVTVSPCIEF